MKLLLVSGILLLLALAAQSRYLRDSKDLEFYDAPRLFERNDFDPRYFSSDVDNGEQYFDDDLATNEERRNLIEIFKTIFAPFVNVLQTGASILDGLLGLIFGGGKKTQQQTELQQAQWNCPTEIPLPTVTNYIDAAQFTPNVNFENRNVNLLVQYAETDQGKGLLHCQFDPNTNQVIDAGFAPSDVNPLKKVQ